MSPGGALGPRGVERGVERVKTAVEVATHGLRGRSEMESPTKRSGRETGDISDVRRSRPKAERQLAVSALEVTDVVRYGMGRGSRIDLTIGCAGNRVRLSLPAKHVLSYGRIAKSAIEGGLLLPYDRSANRAWRKVLSRAMEHAPVEPWLEGEEIAGAIATEMREPLDGCHRGENEFDSG